MDTNSLKKFAQDTRRKLLEQVGAKLSFVLNADSAELREKTEQVKQLREELNKTSKEQLIEKVAYTWFNRLMALRFMDANDYQPLGIRVITPKDGYTTPELLDEAKRGNIPDELRVNKQRVYDLLDNRLPSTNPQNEAYKELLIAACNHLNDVLPFLFERINDYSELLLPDDLTSDFSIVTDVRNGMVIEECQNVEIIGWLYQFYISEKKDEVFASKLKIEKENIPAATQLFTPRWIVEYMVQNTLGKLWLQNRPNSRLREYMPYYIESASMGSSEFLKINSPEEIRFLDPASGSGHILVYAFDLFAKIYEEEGYATKDIPILIIEKNLFGFEIDGRAAQLTGLAIMMKARKYERRIFRNDLQPKIICFQDFKLNSNEISAFINEIQLKISDELIHDLLQMQQATNFGSLIIPHAKKNEIIQFSDKLNQIKLRVDLFQNEVLNEFQISTNQLLILAEKFHCVVANPPYMGSRNMNDVISSYLRKNYPNSKSDLMTCFMDKGISLLVECGLLGMINFSSWIFLSSYENLRKDIINKLFINSLLHIGRGVFGSDFGTVTFIISKEKSDGRLGHYRRLFEKQVDVRSNEKIISLFLDKEYGNFKFDQQKFLNIPSNIYGYWLSENLLRIFKNSESLDKVADLRQGMATSVNDRFIKLWHEVSFCNIGFLCGNHQQAKLSNRKWFPYNKGGNFKKWYGNMDYIVNYKNNGEEILNYAASLYGSPTRTIKSISEYFKPCLSWTKIAYSLSLRYFPAGFIFDVAGCSIFYEDIETLKYSMGSMNSKLSQVLLQDLSGTVNFEVGQLSKYPFDPIKPQMIIINDIVDECIAISKTEWDSNEISWDFQLNDLIRIKGAFLNEFQEALELFIQYWKIKFFQLHKNEEDLNRIFIQIYGLQKELNPIVPLENITILQDELDRNGIGSLNRRLIRNSDSLTVQNYNEILLPFITKEVIEKFISYSIGCMVGRFSLDKNSFILVNQAETLQDYLRKIETSANDCSFLPDEDNIIPVLDDEWFEDDITSRFYQFLKVTFGEANFSKNLAFIEDQLGKDIRKYFTRDFYPDHIKRYKKRPIYWMFSSPKGSFNVLIYMHRYTPDTVNNILNKYLREFIGKLKTRREHLQDIMINGSPAQKTSAIKEDDSIDKMLIELRDYERDILLPLATDRIAIDLDDGVLVNYNKFGKAVKDVAGLNDAATKKKVREFDWIDTTLIK